MLDDIMTDGCKSSDRFQMKMSLSLLIFKAILLISYRMIVKIEWPCKVISA